jgi:hypothetical protein
MMDDIFVYRIRMPDMIREAVTPCEDGYTIYIDDRLDDVHAYAAYQHALDHIRYGDLDNIGNVQKVEWKAHNEL